MLDAVVAPPVLLRLRGGSASLRRRGKRRRGIHRPAGLSRRRAGAEESEGTFESVRRQTPFACTRNATDEITRHTVSDLGLLEKVSCVFLLTDFRATAARNAMDARGASAKSHEKSRACDWCGFLYDYSASSCDGDYTATPSGIRPSVVVQYVRTIPSYYESTFSTESIRGTSETLQRDVSLRLFSSSALLFPRGIRCRRLFSGPFSSWNDVVALKTRRPAFQRGRSARGEEEVR